MTKIIRDADGNVIQTEQRTHGFLKFLGILFGIGFLISVFTSGNIAAILGVVAAIILVLIGTAIIHSNKNDE
jgi:hypothetical protein